MGYSDISLGLSIAFMVVGLVALVWSSDVFVAGSSVLAKALGISPFVIGMVIIGFGTSAPELCVCVMSGLSGHADLSLGNAYGSCSFNIAVILGVALALVLFMWLPAFLVDMFDKYVTHDVLETHNLHPLFEGVLKIIILILYMAGVRRMNEIKRVFQYHGAEHKTIACYENGLELTVENVRAQTRFHPRCGTSFTIVMLLISILFSTILVLLFPGIGTIRWLWVLVKILIIPLIMGFGYEFIRYAGRHDNLLANILSKPGLWMQRITTIEPEDSMIECGIAAFLAVLPEDPETADIQ